MMQLHRRRSFVAAIVVVVVVVWVSAALRNVAMMLSASSKEIGARAMTAALLMGKIAPWSAGRRRRLPWSELEEKRVYVKGQKKKKKKKKD